MLKVQLN